MAPQPQEQPDQRVLVRLVWPLQVCWKSSQLQGMLAAQTQRVVGVGDVGGRVVWCSTALFLALAHYHSQHPQWCVASAAPDYQHARHRHRHCREMWCQVLAPLSPPTPRTTAARGRVPSDWGLEIHWAWHRQCAAQVGHFGSTTQSAMNAEQGPFVGAERAELRHHHHYCCLGCALFPLHFGTWSLVVAAFWPCVDVCCSLSKAPLPSTSTAQDRRRARHWAGGLAVSQAPLVGQQAPLENRWSLLCAVSPPHYPEHPSKTAFQADWSLAGPLPGPPLRAGAPVHCPPTNARCASARLPPGGPL